MYSYTRVSTGERRDSTSTGPTWFNFRPCLCIFVCIGVLLVVVIVLWFVIPSTVFLPDPVVQTLCGESHGYIDNTTNVYVFKGIRYAAPPVGQLRWKTPQSVNESTCKNLNEDPPPCAQRADHKVSSVLGSEDCLYLNIYSPHISPWVPVPVLVYIHGGGFMSGSVSQSVYNPKPELAKSLGTVIVNVQYRLNAFGWMVSKSLPRSEGYVGNYGLHDQIHALKWIQNNIHSFGGDPKKVSILGHGSGATSALLMTSSPQSCDLFHRVIAMSGAPRLTPATYEEAQEQNEHVMEKVGCQDSACMLGLSTEEVLNLIYPDWEDQNQRFDFPQKGYFSPDLAVVDGDIIPSAPSTLWGNDSVPDVPVLFGTTAQEVDISPAPGKSLLNWSKLDLTDHIKHRFETFQKPNLTASQSLAMYESLCKDETEEDFNAECIFTTMVTDIRVTCLTDVMATKMADKLKNPAYRYILTAGPSNSIRSKPFPSRYAFHGLDIIALFDNFHSVLTNTTESDLKLCNDLRDMVKMFIEDGRIEWKRVPQEIGLIGYDIETVEEYHKQRCEYWNQNGLLEYSWVN